MEGFKGKLDHFKNGTVKRSRPFSVSRREGGSTESFFTLISEDLRREWLPSAALMANKDFFGLRCLRAEIDVGLLAVGS